MSIMISDKPFCPKGCKHAYEHERVCAPPVSYDPSVSPEEYCTLSNVRLISTLENLFADYLRYSQFPGGHQPTYMEASRRMGLVRSEMLRRMLDSD